MDGIKVTACDSEKLLLVTSCHKQSSRVALLSLSSSNIFVDFDAFREYTIQVDTHQVMRIRRNQARLLSVLGINGLIADGVKDLHAHMRSILDIQ